VARRPVRDRGGVPAGELSGVLQDAKDRDVTVAFRRLAPRIVTAFADRALSDAGADPSGID